MTEKKHQGMFISGLVDFRRQRKMEKIMRTILSFPSTLKIRKEVWSQRITGLPNDNEQLFQIVSRKFWNSVDKTIFTLTDFHKLFSTYF